MTLITKLGDCVPITAAKNHGTIAWLRCLPVTPSRKGVLKLLQDELQFVNQGGYRRSAKSPWRSPYIFEESPSCPNYGDRSRSHLCAYCWLLAYVQADLREEQVPCRFVQLSPEGATVDTLYRYATPEEAEQTLRKWLQERIRELESEISQVSQLPFAANE